MMYAHRTAKHDQRLRDVPLQAARWRCFHTRPHDQQPRAVPSQAACWRCALWPASRTHTPSTNYLWAQRVPHVRYVGSRLEPPL